MRIKVLLLISYTILYTQYLPAQKINWQEITDGITNKIKLTELHHQLEQTKTDAFEKKQYAVAARCLYHQMQIADLKSEDSAYFINSFYIDSILNEQKTPLLLQSVMLMLKAKRIAGFRHRFSYRTNKNQFRIPKNIPDYRKLNTTELDSLVESYFEQAKKISLGLNDEVAKDLLWLSTDPLLFLYKPDYTDIIFAEQLHYTNAAIGSNINNSGIWLLLKPDEFIKTNGIPRGINSKLKPIYDLYKQWASYHGAEPEIFYFIESLARKYFYYKSDDNADMQPLYENYLLQLTRSPYTAVQAHGVYQLCLLWYNAGNIYSNPFSENKNYLDRYNLVKFDSSSRYYFVKSLELLEKNNFLMDSFLYLKKGLQVIKQEILSKKINIQIQDIYLPGEPVVYHVVFKNTATLHLKIIKLSNPDLMPVQKNILEQQLINSSPYKIITIQLPDTKDFQTHAAKIETGALPVGYYAVLYSDSLIENGNKNVNFFTINVSSITVVNNGSRLFVLNRKTGTPLIKAHVQVKYKPMDNGSSVDAPIKTVNRMGYTIVKEKKIINTLITYGGDTLQVSLNEKETEKPDEVFDKEDDELLDYYEENVKLLLFTDRAIYRPGQTVYFKGILLTRNPVTGARIALTKNNLKFPLLKKLFDKEVQEFSKGKLNIYVHDPFNETTDTISLSPNEYGSFAGTFKISEMAATGDWELATDDIDIDNKNDGHFKVEEYKRPGFEVGIEKPINYLQLGDSFSVKIKGKSFAGAALNNVTVNYYVTASFSYPEKDSINGKESDKWEKITIADTSGSTNNDGELFVKIPSGFLQSYQFPDKKYCEVRYSIDAEAVDATGESQEASLEIRISNRPVKIDFAIANIYDRNELGLISVTAKNEFSGGLTKLVEASIYKLDKKNKTNEYDWDITDYTFNNGQWIYYVKVPSANTEKATLIYQTTLMSNTDKLKLPKEILESGKYRLEIVCRENGNLVGQKNREFSVFDKEKNTYPDTTSDFHHLPINMAANGEKIKWYSGTAKRNIYSIYHVQYFAKTSKGVKVKNTYHIRKEQAGIKEWDFTVPNDAINEIKLAHLYIFNNKLYKQTATLYKTPSGKEDPEIIIEHYRQKLTPGGKEKFVVMIKSKNENVPAELMTTMYDASLDKIEKHSWAKPDERLNYRLNESWQNEITVKSFTSLFEKYPDLYTPDFEEDKRQPLWWLNASEYSYVRFNQIIPSKDNNGGPGSSQFISGRLAGISNLNEVLVTGYGASTKNLTGSVAAIRLRGLSSFGNNNASLVIMDGIVYAGDLNKINLELITDAIVLNGADATAIYGDKAANGVILISTKGPLQLPQPGEPLITIRKNFAETAFFFPQVHADKDGYYNISFTIPESVTEWNWKMLAHTRDAKFMFAQRNIVTQLPLMVQPNMVRFLYQGDILNLQARITNLDTVNLSGFSSCEIEDAVTGEDITPLIVTNAKQNFAVDKKSNTSVGYRLKISENLLHPLKIKITARAGSFSDGEEYIIPIMGKKILVAQNIPFVITNASDTTIQSPGLAADAVPYGIGMYINPKPQSSMVNALPYLAFYPYGCAEQTFNKMLAHALALKIIQTDINARQTMEQLRSLPEEDNTTTTLPDELSEQTMPWLQLNHQTKIHQRQLLKIFDTLQSKRLFEKYLNELVALQNADGGITWFPGGKSNDYMSYYLLGGLGKLKNDSLLFLINQATTDKITTFLTSLLSFADHIFTAPGSNNQYDLFYLFARTYWIKEFPLPGNAALKADSVLSASWNTAHNVNLGKQALLITASMRYKGKENIFYEKAIQQIESIRQLAITDKVNGIRWKDISNADDFDNSDEETITRLAMAFEETGNSENTVDGMIQWLLKAGKQHNWGSTKATAAAVGLLYKHQVNVTGSPIELIAAIKDSVLSVTDNLLKGQLSGFNKISQFPAFISLKKSNNAIATGGFNYYYFTAVVPQDDQSTGVKISKQLFKLNNTGGKWEVIDSSTVLRIADKIKTIITIDAPRQLKYVFIDEKRAASLEPADAISGYEYGEKFSYYKSVRDAGYQFFAEQIPSGITTIAYETISAKEGSFNTGTVSLQCMYQPQVRAYGTGRVLTVIR